MLGCFGGDTRCSGHFALAHGRALVAQRNFSIAPRTGGLQNVRLNSRERQLFGRRYHGPLTVEVNITTSSGLHISEGDQPRGLAIDGGMWPAGHPGGRRTARPRRTDAWLRRVERVVTTCRQGAASVWFAR